MIGGSRMLAAGIGLTMAALAAAWAPLAAQERTVTLEEAIAHGRGKARIGDTVWVVEGPDAPAGAQVRVSAARGTVLVVEPTQGSGGQDHGAKLW